MAGGAPVADGAPMADGAPVAGDTGCDPGDAGIIRDAIDGDCGGDIDAGIGGGIGAGGDGGPGVGGIPAGGGPSSPRINCIACTMPPASAALSIGTTTSRVLGADASAWNART